MIHAVRHGIAHYTCEYKHIQGLYIHIRAIYVHIHAIRTFLYLEIIFVHYTYEAKDDVLT